MTNLIGKKVVGFEFESYKYGLLVFSRSMEDYLGKVGVITMRNEFGWGVRFEDGTVYTYPAEEIERYLVTNMVMRRSGRTTRIIDNIIQDLFTKGEAEIKDHGDFGYPNLINIRTKVLSRLAMEHRISKEKISCTVMDEGKVIIKFKSE